MRDKKLGTKLLQIFGIHKDLTVKIKYIWIFNGKSLVLAQLCERNFGGMCNRRRPNYSKYSFFFIYAKLLHNVGKSC